MKTLVLLMKCLCLTAASTFLLSTEVSAQPSEDRKFLLLYFKEEELVVESPTRGPKSITQVAENITVITADDIRLMNAHTVAEVLNTVTGVQMFLSGGPGSIATATIQGSDARHVAVFIDGVSLNNLGDNVVDLGLLTVQNIEKIEVIKGPASSSWGSGLGGVVNIITKTGKGIESRGMVSEAFGKADTSDIRLEASGKPGKVGYYFTAGRLQTDGFRLHNEYAGDNVFVKLSYDLTNSTTLLMSVGFDDVDRGVVNIPAMDLFINNHIRDERSMISMTSDLNSETKFDLSFYSKHQEFVNHNYLLSTNAEFSADSYRDSGYGGNAKLIWKHGFHNVVAGTEFDSRTLESNAITNNEQGLEKWAVYLNDTLSFDQLSITPGVRFDRTDSNGDFTSPSIGFTYKAADSTIIRATAARGFSIPPLNFTYGNNIFSVPNPNLKMEQTWSYQAGFETTALLVLWLKLSGFRHNIKDVIGDVALTPTTFMAVNKGNQRSEGAEVEIKTMPLFRTSFIAGASFVTPKDMDTGEVLQNMPRKTYDLGLSYDDERAIKATLKGHYVDWNAPAVYEARDKTLIADLHVTAKLFSRDDRALEAFGNIHNIFNGSQYRMSVYPNPGRWIEAGLRYTF